MKVWHYSYLNLLGVLIGIASTLEMVWLDYWVFVPAYIAVGAWNWRLACEGAARRAYYASEVDA